MFQWSNKISKSITFTHEAFDQALLTAIDAELASQPEQTFSNLCKEALGHLFGLSETGESLEQTLQVEVQINGLQDQVSNLEQYLFKTESSRLERLESQLHQLTLQVTQLTARLEQQPAAHLETNLAVPPEVEFTEATNLAVLPEVEVTEATSQPIIEDPLLSRLSSLMDTF
jgi:hypothetical protein